MDDALAQALPPPDEDDRRQLATLFGVIDPPQDVEFERYISPDEFAAVMVPCLTDQGFSVKATSDGGITFEDIAPEQAAAQSEALYRCRVRFAIHPLFEEPLNDGQLRRLYDYLTGDLTPCLEREGYVIPQPPTVETFVASYSDPSATVWSPYPVNDPRLERPEEWDRLNQACPQSPSLEVLYGDADDGD